MNLAERKRKRRHFKKRYDTEMKVNKKSKTDLFSNRIHARLRKILEKEPQNEKKTEYEI